MLMKRSYIALLLICAFLVYLANPVQASAADGEIDQTFGNGGFIVAGRGFALAPGGKIVVVEGGQLSRYNIFGNLDPTFGVNGVIPTNVPSFFVAVQPDGKIVTAGSSSLDIAVARYNIDGSLDSTFGGGVVWTRHAVPPRSIIESYSGVTALAVSSDGKIFVMAGDNLVRLCEVCAGGLTSAALLLQIDGNGTVVSNGPVLQVFIVFQSQAHLAQRDDTVVLGKMIFPLLLSITRRSGPITGGAEDMFSIGNGPMLSGLAIQSSNKILALTSRGLLRYNLDGNRDLTFGNNGQAPSELGAVTTQPNDKIIVAGENLTRYTVDGSIDSTFGIAGVVEGGGGGDVKVQPDGKILVQRSNTITRYKGTPPSPQAAIQSLIDGVNALLELGVLAPREVRGLMSKLDSTLTALSRGDNNAARDHLRAFTNLVGALISTGRISPAQGQFLTEGAESVIAH
jgi:uncharacterized delta-60 repeat protein